jgi:TPR repeat protein
MTTLPDQYFSLFQQQIDACQIPDQNRHTEIRRGLNREIKQCITDLKKLSNQDNPEIWYALGHAATFFEKNITQATAWYQKAADAGHTQAITKMGNRLRQSELPEDQEKSQQWLSKAAEQGDSYAMLCLGFAHRDGKGVPRDLKLAQHWFERSRAAGDPTAIEHLAELLFKHQHSPAQALPYYLEAQAKGMPCDEPLAEIYNTRGSGVYDPLKAKEHYEILLRRGKKPAPWVMLELAKLHASGQVSDNGLTHARKWCYQIISQCPKTGSAIIKAERLLKKLDESLF